VFFAHGFLELDAEGSSGKVQASTFCTESAVDLDIEEPRARVFLNTGSSEDKLDSWYLTSGTTHHMIGHHELFTNLDCKSRGTVKFSDASKVEILGVGSIIFEVKTDEHWVLHDVYYILLLHNLIMSLGQLDEGSSDR
jgi:hypothetical protein